MVTKSFVHLSSIDNLVILFFLRIEESKVTLALLPSAVPFTCEPAFCLRLKSCIFMTPLRIIHKRLLNYLLKYQY